MPMRLEGSSRCGAISFSVDIHTPYPHQRCSCSICRKSGGGGGYATNIMGLADTLKVKGKRALGVGMHRSRAIRARPTEITASAERARDNVVVLHHFPNRNLS